MGISILELVLRRLREAKFTADVAFPGQKFPQITKPVAAVHIEKVDRANMAVTVEVNIICPAAMGGTACEVEALRATEILRWSGAVCIQNGCTYDGISQVYVVAILATFTCVTEASTCSLGPGFRAYINDIVQPNAIAFSEEEVSGVQAEYVTGESAPAVPVRGAAFGTFSWRSCSPPVRRRRRSRWARLPWRFPRTSRRSCITTAAGRPSSGNFPERDCEKSARALL